MKNNETCFGYTRVSTVKQGEGVSLEAQKEAIEAFAIRNQLSIIKWFEEKETAAKSGRPVFSAMIKELRKGKAANLIIHKIDRSARNLADWAKIGELSDAGINVHFATESLDFRSRGGRLTADIQAVIAADYVRNLREETIKGLNGRLKQGLYPWKAPIGYLDNGGGKVKTIDPLRAPLVKKLFELYASGEVSIYSLVEKAKQLGLRSRNDKIISKSCIENMLANPFYIGIIHLKRRDVNFAGKHEPLISSSLFKQVAAMRAGRSVRKRTKHDFTFRRIINCKKCEKPFVAERQKGLIYYRCHTRKCSPGTIRSEKIETAILSAIRELELPVIAHKTIDLMRQTNEKQKKQNTKPVQAIQLGQNKQQQNRLLDALLDNIIDKTTYEKRNLELLERAVELEEHLVNLNTQRQNLAQNLRIFETFKNLYFIYSIANSAEKRQIIELLFSNRLIENKNVEILPRNWVFQLSNIDLTLFGPPVRGSNRSGKQIPERVYEDLEQILIQPELKKLGGIIESIEDRNVTA